MRRLSVRCHSTTGWYKLEEISLGRRRRNCFIREKGEFCICIGILFLFLDLILGPSSVHEPLVT